MSAVLTPLEITPQRPNCVAGHVGFEPANVIWEIPFELSNRFRLTFGDQRLFAYELSKHDMHLSEKQKQPDYPGAERDFSSAGGAPLPARFPSATSASARALGSLSLSSSRSSGTAASIPGCRGPRRPRCHAARLRTK